MLPQCRHVTHLDGIDLRESRSLVQPAFQSLGGLWGSLELDLDATVREVANPADDPELGGRALCRGSEADCLDAA